MSASLPHVVRRSLLAGVAVAALLLLGACVGGPGYAMLRMRDALCRASGKEYVWVYPSGFVCQERHWSERGREAVRR